MKSLTVAAFSAILVISGTAVAATSTTNATKSTEEICKEHAAKKHVAADKLEAYVKTCVEKHTKKKATTSAKAHTDMKPKAATENPASEPKM